ncbi:MAG: helix-turn-helix transcriptional regulator [Oscillospiraceae bacterium]|nr:helix-turn-helix transcriptional regulator [Oscillospiraceae bacterium]
MKNNPMIPSMLRKHRLDMKLTLEELSAKLSNRGIEVSAKTLNGYEKGVSYPNVNTFICLCDIFGIENILSEFGYSAPSPALTPAESILLADFRLLNDRGQNEALFLVRHLAEKDEYKKSPVAGSLPAVR